MLTKDQHCIELILEAIDRIFEYTSDFNSADDLNSDYRNFDATMMNFIVIGEMVEKLSDDLKSDILKLNGQKLRDSEILLRMTISVLMLKRFGK